MNRNKLFLLLFFSISFCQKIEAQFYTYTNEFLNIGAGARAMSMGNATVASVNDATAGYWNPAGLAFIRNVPTFSVMHADYFSGIAGYDFFAAAIPMQDDKRTIGITALRFGVDNIPNTLTLVDPQSGQFNWNNISSFSASDYAFLLSYGQVLKNTEDIQMSFGGNVKIIYRSVGSFGHAWGLGIDAGFQAVTPTWRVGVTARDITTTYNSWSYSFSDDEKEELLLAGNIVPSSHTEITQPGLIIGGGYNFVFSPKFSLLAESNLHVTFDGKRNTLISSKPISIDPNLGLEANIADKVFIRGGISNFQQGISDADSTNQKKKWIFQPSIGAGFHIGNVIIDYAFVNLANQSNSLYTHVFSLRLDLEKKSKKLSFIK
ncbi:MAG: PorV/PorQ family protein [Arachidicoccus sp.]|nr:PorV/PorQ family protein [Arachidicoccus sp.]